MDESWIHPRTALAAIAACGFALAAPSAALATGGHDNSIETRLRSFNEVPAISSAAQGRFKAWYDEASRSVRYELSYSGLEGDVRQAHIHFGQRGVNGGIMVWLCQTTFNVDPTGRSPTCPQSGTVGGVLDAASIRPIPNQGIAETEFAKFVGAVRAGAAYVNVHSLRFPGGEIRGQLRGDD